MGTVASTFPPGEVTAAIELGVRGRRVSLTVTVSTGPTTPRDMLPFARAITEVATRVAAEDAAAAGEPVTCRAGCGACCRQLVPISEPEAYLIAELVAALPEPRRSAVRERFAAARRRLEEAGLLDALLHPAPWGDGERLRISRDYFALGLPCLFLEDESCSIHPDRPLVCREFLVSSPAERCRDPYAGGVTRVDLPVVPPFRTFAVAAGGTPVGEPIRWVPLVVAPEWAAAHPEPPPDRPGPDRLRELFARMTGAAAPPRPGGGDAN